jgi:hypothetical protein
MQRICSAPILAIEINAAATIGCIRIRCGFESRALCVANSISLGAVVPCT